MSDVKEEIDQLMRWLLWSRKQGFLVGPTVQIGSVTVQVRDIRLAKREALRDPGEPDGDIYSEMGLDDDAEEPVEGTAG